MNGEGTLFFMRKQMKSPRRRSQKERYKITNWPEYNRSLIERGKINIWISEHVRKDWLYKGEKNRGGQFVFSDTCIETCLCIKYFYKMGYRQTQGFIESLFSLAKYHLPVPGYADMCKRSRNLEIKQKHRGKVVRSQRITIAADSTGLKVYGEGEWKVRKHGWSKHRTWQKLHIAVEQKVK
jgi:hypothetical protein